MLFGSTGDKLGAIPDFLKDSKVHMEMVEDMGSIRKLLPALLAGFEQIISADDDVVYGDTWAADLIWWSTVLPDFVLAYRGRNLVKNRYDLSRLVTRRIKIPKKVDIITTTFGAIYNSKFFDDSGIRELWKTWPDNDDLVVTKALRNKNIPIYVVPSTCKIRDYDVRFITPLSDINRPQKDKHNNEGLKTLGLI